MNPVSTAVSAQPAAATRVVPSAQRVAVLEHLAACHDVITAAQARALGLSGVGLRHLLFQRVLRRVARGAFVAEAAWQSSSADERHVLTTRAIVQTWPDGVSVSHTSAARLWDIPLTVPADGRVHGARRRTGQHRRTDHYTIHTGYPRARHHRLRGLVVLEPAYVILGVAELHGLDEAVVAGDGALHSGLLTTEDLCRARDDSRHHPTRRVFDRAIASMDERCESPGESRSRLLLRRLGYAVRSQVVIQDGDGGFIGRVDLLIEGTRVIVEFDGLTKYTSPEHLRAEKRRETRLVRAGYRVVRLLWSDLDRPDRVRRLIEEALAASR